jgi:ubiquinone/menaquinone biosynthesis C-methylase UbiE
MNSFLKYKTVEGISHARALLYSAESLPLPIMHRLVTGEVGKITSAEERNDLLNKVRQLLKEDAQDFADLGWPLRMLRPESPSDHFSRWFQILFDSSKSFWRRREKDTQSFSKKIKEELGRYPKYYQRNFHHQTDGYLSDHSAYLYEHQVELLFRGTADPMRRRLLRPLYQKFKNRKSLRILEIGCGSGTFTEFMSLSLPRAEITGLDLSPNYIRHGRKRFIENKNVNLIVGDGEQLPFKDNWFDAVVSVYLHHELPEKVRENVIKESLRVCKPKGFWGLADSIQLGDDPNLDWAIQEFPKNFHEPFFTNYIKKPLSKTLEKLEPDQSFGEEVHLLTKVICKK